MVFPWAKRCVVCGKNKRMQGSLLCAACHPSYGNQIVLREDWRKDAKTGIDRAVEDAKGKTDESPDN